MENNQLNFADVSDLENLLQRIEKHKEITLPFSNNNFCFRPGEVTVWAGKTGSGKSLLIGQIALSLAEQRQKSCIAAFNTPPELTLKRILGQVICGQGKEFNRDMADEFFPKIMDYIRIYSGYGMIEPNNIFMIIKQSTTEYGISHFFIDSLSSCAEYESEQTDFIRRLTKLAIDLNIHIHLVSTIHNPDIHSLHLFEIYEQMELEGLISLADIASNIFILSKNDAKFNARMQGYAVDDSKPDYVLQLVKQRNGEWKGLIPLWFNDTCLTFCDTNDRIPSIKYF